MIPRGPVLYVKHAALDNVNPNDIDGLREVWSSFSGAKQHISQGTRLEYLSWRLYSRSIMQRQRQSTTQSHLPVPELDVPPALEMSSSSDSLTPATGRLSSQKLMTLFDRIVTLPATPENLDKQEPETGPLPCGSIDNEPAPVVKVTPVSTPELEMPPAAAAHNAGPVAIPSRAEQSPAVCGFDKVSVSSRSTANVASILGASPLKSSLKSGASASSAASSTGSGTPGSALGTFSSRAVPLSASGSGSKMFFIESSSDSEAESDHGLSPSPLMDAIPVPVAARPGLVRRKTVTFEEPSSASIAPLPVQQEDDDEQEQDEQENDDDFEDCSDDDEDAPEASGSEHDWGDSDWDDLSEDDEPLFSGRDVPLQPQEHRSLLSSMFVGCGPQEDAVVDDEADEADLALEDEGVMPSPISLPQSIPTHAGSSIASSSSSSVHLGRVESQSSMFDHAMRDARGAGPNHEQILLRGPIRTHRPFRNTKSSEDLMERELSQSVRSNISNKRQYDLDALWAKQNAGAKAVVPPQTRGRRPTLSRSLTVPDQRSFGLNDSDDNTDTSYHARGW